MVRMAMLVWGDGNAIGSPTSNMPKARAADQHQSHGRGRGVAVRSCFSHFVQIRDCIDVVRLGHLCKLILHKKRATRELRSPSIISTMISAVPRTGMLKCFMNKGPLHRAPTLSAGRLLTLTLRLPGGLALTLCLIRLACAGALAQRVGGAIPDELSAWAQTYAASKMADDGRTVDYYADGTMVAEGRLGGEVAAALVFTLEGITTPNDYQQFLSVFWKRS